MAKKATKKAASQNANPLNPTDEKDSTFFLKLVLYIILGSFWLKFQEPIVFDGIQFAGTTLQITGIPLGLVIGLLFARHDHFQIDRKIEYALLLIVGIVTFFLPAGIIL